MPLERRLAVAQLVHVRRDRLDLIVREVCAPTAAHWQPVRRILDRIGGHAVRDDRDDLVVAAGRKVHEVAGGEIRSVLSPLGVRAVAAHTARGVEERIAHRHHGRRDAGRQSAGSWSCRGGRSGRRA